MKALIQSLMSLLNISKNEFYIKDDNLYNRFIIGGDLSLIFGESYMAGEWESDDLTAFFNKILCYGEINQLLLMVAKEVPFQMFRMALNIIIQDTITQCIDAINNNQSIILSKRVADNHYDIPDILYKYMLDSQRQYTCGYWGPNISTLEDAQLAKINLLIYKLQIPDDTEMHILDIGCGWGGLVNAISIKYPLCKVEGISISMEQIKFANDKYGNSNCYYCDYRNLINTKKYDRIVSVGMFEHVGVKNYGEFFAICNNILTDDGIMVLQTITSPNQAKYYVSKMNRYCCNLWVDKYIFPGGYVPTPQLILDAINSEKLMYHHIQNLSISYAKTLDAWKNNFNMFWENIRLSNETFFTDKFFRMWNFYLSSFSAAFNNKKLYLSQFVITKKKYNKIYTLDK
jgi:cyclopropane-fatty-acyl-phospholipid synthase